MKNKFKLIPALLVAPLLFMGNSKVSHVWPDYYVDYEITNITFGEQEEDGYPFSVTVQNNGDSYIDIGQTFEITTRTQYFKLVENSVLDSFIPNLLLAPHSSMTCPANEKSEEVFSLDDGTVNVYCYAYKVTQEENESFEYEWTGFKFKEKKLTDGGAYYYIEALDFFVEGSDYYHFAKVYDLTIKGEKYSFIDNNSDNILCFGLKDDTLTAEDITVDNFYVIRGSSTGKKETERILMGLGWFGIACLIGIGIFITIGIFPLFILPPIIRKAKSKKENKKEA